MARFPYFSCIRSSKGETEGSSEGKHDYDKPKLLRCYANSREKEELIVAVDPGCVLGEHVYKGILENGQEVAVKWFDELGKLRADVYLRSGLEHPNLVKMIAYCDHRKDHIVVYEFIPCGTLNLHLHDLQPGKKPLDWNTRMKIAHGVAKALEYLHDQHDPPVIFSGVRNTNILLDKNYNPKLADFSCAMSGPKANYLRLDARLMRGYGYIAPEYAMNPILTLKSDVYSFGILLLELISGEKPIEENIRGSGMHTIVSWTQPLLNDRKFSEIADPLMKGQYPYAGLDKALNLAKMCVKREPHERPPMAEVVITLSKVVSLIYEEPQVTTVADPFTTPPTMLRTAQVA